MENASKALMMAAEVLVGILLLSLVAVLFYFFANYQAEIQNNEAMKETYELNSQFEAYEDRTLTPQDVLSIYNLVRNYNYEKDGNFIKISGLTENVVNTSEFLSTNHTYRIKKIEYNQKGFIEVIVIQKTN